MAEARGIEIFGRGATIVETAAERPRRGPWLGLTSVLIGMATIAATTLGVLSASAGDAAGARWLAMAGIGCGILGAAVGFIAVAAGRGVGAGLLGMVLSVVANPWILTRVLEWAGSLGGAAS